MNGTSSKEEQRTLIKLLVILLYFSAASEYVAWATLLVAFIVDTLLNLRCFHVSKMPGMEYYSLFFLQLIIAGLLFFEPSKRGYWPLLRDAINYSFMFLYWFFASKLIRRYQCEVTTIYKAIILYATVLSVWSLIQRFAGYNGTNEDFSEFVSSGAISQFAVAVGLYLMLFKAPTVEKNYFGKVADMLIEVILVGTFALSFSRTTILIILCLVIVGRYDQMSAIIKLVLLAIAGVTIASYLLPNVWTTFMDKILNSVTEVSTTNKWSNYNVVNNWRGFEIYRAQMTFCRYNLFQEFFGKGFGATVDVGHYAYLVTSEASLPFLHNGYYTTLIKGGIGGIVLTVGYYISSGLHYLKCNISKYERRLCIGLILAMAVSMTVIHGFFWGGAQLLVFYILGSAEKEELL